MAIFHIAMKDATGKHIAVTAKRFSMSITHHRIIPTEERQEARHGSVTRNAGEDEAGLSKVASASPSRGN
jgi:hypothetical protein